MMSFFSASTNPLTPGSLWRCFRSFEVGLALELMPLFSPQSRNFSCHEPTIGGWYLAPIVTFGMVEQLGLTTWCLKCPGNLLNQIGPKRPGCLFGAYGGLEAGDFKEMALMLGIFQGHMAMKWLEMGNNQDKLLGVVEVDGFLMGFLGCWWDCWVWFADVLRHTVISCHFGEAGFVTCSSKGSVDGSEWQRN